MSVIFSRPIFKKSQYFRRAEKVVPLNKISNFFVPKSSQYIFRKSQKNLGYTYYKNVEEFKNSTRWGGIHPPPWALGLNCSYVVKELVLDDNFRLSGYVLS